MNKYILLLFLIPTLLLSKVDNLVVHANANVSKSRTGLSALILLVSNMSDTVHSLQSERGASSGFISSDGEKFSSELNATRKNSDLAISTLMNNVNINKNLLSEYLSDSEFANLSRNNKELSLVRKDVDNLKIDFTIAYSKYTRLIALLFLNISDVSDKIKDKELSSLLYNYSILQLYEESIGQKRAVLSALFSKKSFLQEIYEYYLTSDVQGNIYLKTFLHNSNENTKKLYDKKLKDASALELELELEKYEKLAYAVLNGKVVDINPIKWFDTVTKKINLIQDIEHKLLDDILIVVDKLNNNQINLTKDEKNWLENHQVLKVGNEPDYAPWDFNKDGKPMGYSIDYINLLTSKLGIKVEYTLEPWDDLVKKLTNKELDVLHTMFKNNNRKSVIYSDSYKKVITALFVHENNNDINSTNDLATKTVSIPKNDSTIVSFKEQFPNTKISEPSSYLNAIKEVSLNKSDATILELGVANYLIKEYNIPNIKIVDEINPPSSEIDYSFRFGIRDDYAILVSILNKAMQSVSQDELDVLDKRWLNKKNKKVHIEWNEEEKSWISEHKKIRFAGDPNWLPLEAFDENDKYIGIVSEYLKSIKEAAGINFEIIQTKNFDESISLAKAGDVDIISEFIDSELQKDLIFTNSYIANPLIIVMNEKANYVENLKDIKDKKIAVIKGYGYFSKLQKEYPNIQFENVDTIQDGLIAVSTSEIDAFVCTSMIGSYHISKMGLSNIKIVGKTKVITELGLGVRKDYAPLVSIINKALANITKEEHSAIFGKWISVKSEKETRWTLILQIVGAGFLIFAFIIYNNRKLKKLVDKRTIELQASLSSFDKNVIASKTDLNGIIIYVSEAFCEISGYKLNEVIGKPHNILHHPDMSLEVFADMWKTLKSGNIWRGEIKNLKKDGGFYWAYCIAQPYYDSNGKHIGYSAIRQNITAQKEVEELSATLEQKVEVRTKELEESRLFLHTLIDVQEQIIITTQDYHIASVNKKFLDFYKVKEIEEFIEKYSSECICGTFNTAAPHGYIQEMMDTQSWIDYVIENNKRINKVMISQNGIDYIFSVNAANFPGHNGLKAAVFTDITDMEKATRAKSEFISNMSHEIRTPMNAVLGFTELLEETEVSTKQGSYIRSIKSGAKSLLTIINDILDLSKIEAGRLSLEYENNNMEELLQDIAQIFSINLQKKGLDFELNYDKKLPKTLIVDSGRIRQILFNLIGNAIKFTDKGFIKILVHASDAKDGYIDLSISVADSGVGIPKDDYEKIFKSFEQQDGQSNRKYGGTGLGLTISNKLAKMMNGNITLESEVDKGSIFTLNLYDIEIGNKDVISKKEAKGVIEFDEATILIVDDVEENRKLIIEHFLSSNLNFLEAEDGEEAVALALEKLPDLIIMDLKMPKMDGYEAMRKIKELSQDGAPPIIALTASVDATKEHIDNEGFDGFLTKPITKQELVNELALFLKHTISVDESEGNNEKLESSYDIDITKTSPREVLEALSGDITDEFERVQFGGAFNDIENFSNKLKEIAQKHNYDGLLLYAQKVDNAIEVFDIEEIDLLMSEYKEILKRIREMLDERA